MVLDGSTTVLEIGSGSGQHATGLTAAMGGLDWQTSDRRCNHATINAWLAANPAPGVRPPIALDVLEDAPPAARYDAVFSANTAHIMSQRAVEKMFEVVGQVLRDGGRFCLYGPFRQDGRFNSPSNAQFDQSLRSRDPMMGIRDLELLDDLGRVQHLMRTGLYAMPANNHLVVWDKQKEPA